MEFKQIGDLRYHQKGKNPQIVFYSGTHGDEYHIIEPLISLLDEMYNELPDFLFIPEVSPSAIAQKTRLNKYGNNMNRKFGSLTDPEAIANKQLLSHIKGAVGISFHEDLEYQHYYVYDTAGLQPEVVDALRKHMQKMNVPLHTGIDDASDLESLGFSIENGYVLQPTNSTSEGTFIEDWAIHHGYMSKFLTFEIPHAHEKLKEILRISIAFGVEVLEYSLPVV